MTSFARSAVTAVLGPTNTGKTHLAVERLCAHASGIMGFPLRLLAREIYDRVVTLKGEAQVGLITGEEKILPPGAKYLLTTVESMPLDQQAAFVAVDEVQLGADPERGHVFTDRLLRARGYAETMFLGSDSMSGLVRSLVPEAEIIGRPRFSTLSYAGHKKLSRLPRRSAIVAFSAEEVYAIAEALRRLRGGAAVVMGALSPRTRNAQVAMYQAGEVDYLVATDAIGMGLNLDVNHVAFASLNKFDGRRLRRLTIAEMAQIAGRAGRHQQDGTFGTVGNEAALAFTPEEIEAIEEHRFPRMSQLYWRKGDPSLDSVDALLADLEAQPDRPQLVAAPEAIDLAVLKRLADEADVRGAATSPAMVRRLWDVCGVPDFLKMGADHHARLIHRLWRYRSGQAVDGGKGGGMAGHVDGGWFADQLARLDRTDGDVETLAARIAGVRTWCYIAHRPDWLLNADIMAERARAVETRLSDALHERLTQRFVDRRTSLLLRSLGEGDKALAVSVTADNAVLVEGEEIGTLHGFRFIADKAARASDHRLLLAAAEKHLAEEYQERAAKLAAAPDAELSLRTEPGGVPAILWQEDVVAELAKGGSLLAPTVQIDKHLRGVTHAQQQEAIRVRLATWLNTQIGKHAEPLVKAHEIAGDAQASGTLRGFLAPFVDEGGIAQRHSLDRSLAALTPEDRARIKPLGLAVGSLDLFLHAMLKPEPARWRLALLSLWHGRPLRAQPPAGAVRIVSEDRDIRDGARDAGFRSLGPLLLRIDMIERVARNAHEQRVAAEQVVPEADRKGRARYPLDATLATSLGLDTVAFHKLLAMLGFRPARGGGDGSAANDGPTPEGTELEAAPAAAEAAEPAKTEAEAAAAPASEEPAAFEPAAEEPATETPATGTGGGTVTEEATEATADAPAAATSDTETAASGSATAEASPPPAVVTDAPLWSWHGRVKEHHGRDRRDGNRSQPRRKPNVNAAPGAPRKKRPSDRRNPGPGGPPRGPRREEKPARQSNPAHSPFAGLADLLGGSDKGSKD